MAKARVFRGDPERKQVALYDNFLGGMNTTSIDSQVKTNEFRILQNVELSEEGRIQKRKGWRNFKTINEDFFSKVKFSKIYYFNVLKDERRLFNNLDEHDGNYEITVELIATVFSGGLEKLRHLIYTITRDKYTKDHEVDIDVSGEYLDVNINEIDVLNYSGRRYVLLNQIVDKAEAILEFYEDDNMYVTRVLDKNNSYSPNAYEVRNIGFNLFKENTLSIGATSEGQRSIVSIYVTDYGNRFGDKNRVYESIPVSGKFTLSIMFTSDSSFIENLDLKLFKRSNVEDKKLEADISGPYIINNWAYYDITLEDRPNAGDIIIPEFTLLNENDVKTVNDEPYESYEALFYDYYNKKLTNETTDEYKKYLLVNRITDDRYKLLEADDDHPFSYGKFKYKDSEGDESFQYLDESVFLYHSKEYEYKYFKRSEASGIVYGRAGSYTNTYFDVFSLNELNYGRANVFEDYVVNLIEKYNEDKYLGVKNLDNLPEVDYNIKWKVRHIDSYQWSELEDIEGKLERIYLTVPVFDEQHYEQVIGTSYNNPKRTRENYIMNNYLSDSEGYLKPSVLNDATYPNGKELKHPALVFRVEEIDTGRQLDEFTMVLSFDTSSNPRITLEDSYSNYKDHIMTQDKSFSVIDDNEIKIVHYNGLGEEPTVDTDYKDYFDDGTSAFVEYEYQTELVVMNSEPLDLKPINLSNMKGIIINDRLVLYGDNNIIWSDVFSTATSEDLAGEVEQSFTYFPNFNWATLSLSYNDEIQKIAYYRGSWIIFTKETIYRMNGEFTEQDMEIVMINDVIGCVSPGSIRGINNTLVFLSEDGLYALRQNYYQEGLENVVKIDEGIKGVIPYGVNYESTLYREQYLLHMKNFDGEYTKTLKQYYNMVNTSKEIPYTIDVYRETPNTMFRHLGKMYSFYNNNLYVYGEEYIDFAPLDIVISNDPDEDESYLYAYEMIIETAEWDLEHPLHEKKFKNIFLKLNSTNVVEMNFRLIFDKNVSISEENFYMRMNSLGELEYIRNYDPNLKTDGRLELGKGKLAEAFLGDEGYQVHKVDPGEKGRVLKIRIENKTADRIAIDAISLVYKLGKMRENR